MLYLSFVLAVILPSSNERDENVRNERKNTKVVTLQSSQQSNGQTIDNITTAHNSISMIVIPGFMSKSLAILIIFLNRPLFFSLTHMHEGIRMNNASLHHE